ncbi:MAG: flagellar hook-basal body protein [Clostridiales bacterium]|jgi:flagellar basal-body rod protein FlgG|nr:flagellar hook-basal body protein [Clostridiales bacterium]
MMQAASTAKMALLAQQTRMDTIANNLANVNTAGFKTRSVTFKDMLYTTMRRQEGEQTVNLQKGTGVKVGSTDLSMYQGIPEMTGATLDFFIDGDAMFMVREPNTGETYYTRNGAFMVSLENDGAERYIVTAQGYYLLDENGERINIPEDGKTEQVRVSMDGTLYIVGDDGESAGFAQVGRRWFNNPYGLYSEGNTMFSVSESSGEAVAARVDVKLLQGYIEASNTDTSVEMVNLIKTQRAYSFASRAITTADEMDAIANNMRT